MNRASPNYTTGVKIVAEQDIVPPSRLGFSSFCYGLGLFVLLCCEIPVFVFLERTNIPQPLQQIIFYSICALTLIASPLPGLFRWRIQLATFRRRVISILFVAVGLASVPWLTSMIFTAHLLFMAEGQGAWVLQAICSGFLGIPTAALIWSLVAHFVWPIILDIAPFRIQDGTTCPKCGYCLRGVSSRICPECGRAFNRHDLGLSKADFDVLVSGIQSTTPTAAST